MGGKERIVTSLYVQWWMANFVLGEESVSMEDASVTSHVLGMEFGRSNGLDLTVTLQFVQSGKLGPNGLYAEVLQLASHSFDRMEHAHASAIKGSHCPSVVEHQLRHQGHLLNLPDQIQIVWNAKSAVGRLGRNVISTVVEAFLGDDASCLCLRATVACHAQSLCKRREFATP
jgi:hypothetical protein